MLGGILFVIIRIKTYFSSIKKIKVFFVAFFFEQLVFAGYAYFNAWHIFIVGIELITNLK